MGAFPHGRIRPGALAALLWWTGVVAAEEKSADSLPSVASAPARHRLPPRIIEAVAAKVPKYQAPKESEKTSAPSGESEERDGVLYLPNVKVTAAKPLELSEFAWLSPKGRLDLAMKKYPGLRLLPLSKMNGSIALAMQREEREATKRDELKAAVQSVAVFDDAQSRDLMKKMRDAVARPNTDWTRR